MMAGLVLISAAAGLVAMAAMFAYSAPVLLALVSCSAIGSLTLLVSAALCSIRASQPSQASHLLPTTH